VFEGKEDAGNSCIGVLHNTIFTSL